MIALELEYFFLSLERLTCNVISISLLFYLCWFLYSMNLLFDKIYRRIFIIYPDIFSFYLKSECLMSDINFNSDILAGK